MRTGFFIVLTLLGYSCTEISYKEPQPKGVAALKKIPGKLQGRYQLSENGSVLDVRVVVFERGYRIEPKDTTEKTDEFLLSDSLVLKHYKGYYFLNIRSAYSWRLRIVERKKNGDLQLIEMKKVPEGEASSKEFLDKLQAEVPVIKTEVNGYPQYLIDPTPRKLLDLIKKGFFGKKTLFVKESER
jgi:hypothetical protein